jgi:hypothetical protein
VTPATGSDSTPVDEVATLPIGTFVAPGAIATPFTDTETVDLASEDTIHGRVPVMGVPVPDAFKVRGAVVAGQLPSRLWIGDVTAGMFTGPYVAHPTSGGAKLNNSVDVPVFPRLSLVATCSV